MSGTASLSREGEVYHVQTVEAVINARGAVRLFQPVRVSVPRRALLTILEEQPAGGIFEMAELSEFDLAEDWQRPQNA